MADHAEEKKIRLDPMDMKTIKDIALKYRRDPKAVKMLVEWLEEAYIAGAERMRSAKDQAYTERNALVAALASMLPSGVRRTQIEGWDRDWDGAVYIDFPGVGNSAPFQGSWHFHDSQEHFFFGLPKYTQPWDGHTTDIKYVNLMKFVQQNIAAKKAAAPPMPTPAPPAPDAGPQAPDTAAPQAPDAADHMAPWPWPPEL